MPTTYTSTSAVLSPCRRYRYELWRAWGDGPFCMFIGLNPSTADESQDDPTIRKCVGFAQRWGYNRLCMTNLFAFRATQPKDMLSATDPVGPENDGVLQSLAPTAGVVVAAWGKDGSHRNRDRQVIAMMPRLKFLRRNGDGSPGHPLYLPYGLTPQAWRTLDPDLI